MVKHEILFLVFSYLLGAIPFGYILYYLTEKKDIREEGSGNIGATNVLRAKGKIFGIITLVLDMLKGILPILYGLMHFDSPVLIIGGGAAAILGHLYSVYLKFKGGKGVSTFLGMAAVFHFPSALVFGAVFLFTYFLTRYVSASSIAGVTAIFFVTLFTNVVEVSMIVFVVVLLIIIKHHGNIKRIIAGTEPQLSWKKNG
ncbi:MAG: glycerol-3-phosphate 1-O-acyltransferase PlsY [Candidatus Aminicenantes bacterium]|nr:MAG: glycerol-3-phosphate 1-O-acyltransferase PlsY [Candidatus Aminicenantes bacterium]